MSFILVDRLLEIDSGRYAKGIKHISHEEPYLIRDPQGEVIFLPSLMSEAVGQCCAWSVMHKLDFKFRPVAGIGQEIIIHRTAKPGDTLLMEAFVDQLDDERVLYHAHVTINGKKALTLTSALGPLVAMHEFIDPDVARQQFNVLHRPVDDDVHDSAPALEPQDDLKLWPHPQFDRLLEWNPGVSIRAEKLVSITSLYFIDHFPRNPVLPLTYLTSCVKNLSDRLLRDHLGDECFKQFSLSRFEKIKMTSFVKPGDRLIGEAKLISQTPEEIKLRFSCWLSNKRMYICQVVYQPQLMIQEV